MDKKVISCAFNIGTACVEVRFVDGSMISVDCTLVEAEVARNMYESSELEWLVYNAPVDYVNLLLHGDVREYLRNVTEYRGFSIEYQYKNGKCRYRGFSIEYQYKNGKCRRLSSCGLTGVCILTDCMIAYWVRSRCRHCEVKNLLSRNHF